MSYFEVRNAGLRMSYFLLQDPVKEGEAKIKADFAELHDHMQTAFRNLEEF